jgi:hypothetical protein
MIFERMANHWVCLLGTREIKASIIGGFLERDINWERHAELDFLDG